MGFRGGEVVKKVSRLCQFAVKEVALKLGFKKLSDVTQNVFV